MPAKSNPFAVLQDKPDYELQLRGLNHSFGESVRKRLETDPTADLTTLWKQYEKHLESIKIKCDKMERSVAIVSSAPATSGGFTSMVPETVNPSTTVESSGFKNVTTDSNAFDTSKSAGLTTVETLGFSSGTKPVESSGFSFGAKPAESSGFSFGAKPTDSSGAKSTGLFSFGSNLTEQSSFGVKPIESSLFGAKSTEPTSFGTTSTQSFSFGTKLTESVDKPATAAPGATPFSFTAPSSFTAPPSFATPSSFTTPFSFNASAQPFDPKTEDAKPFQFSFGAPQPSFGTPAQQTVDLTGDDDGIPSGEEESFANTRSNMDLITTGAGEEEEETLAAERCKLFVFSGGWTDLGVCILKINKRLDSRNRVLARMEGSGKILLNSWIGKDVQVEWIEGKKEFSLLCVNQDGKPAKYLVRCKEAELAEKLSRQLKSLI
jgi:hypothetical protein